MFGDGFFDTFKNTFFVCTVASLTFFLSYKCYTQHKIINELNEKCNLAEQIIKKGDKNYDQLFNNYTTLLNQSNNVAAEIFYRLESITPFIDLLLWENMYGFYDLYFNSELYNPHMKFNKQFYLNKTKINANNIIKAHTALDQIIDSIFKDHSAIYSYNKETHLICRKEASLFFNKLLTLNELNTLENLILNNKNEYIFEDQNSSIKKIWRQNNKNLPFAWHKNFQDFNFHKKI